MIAGYNGEPIPMAAPQDSIMGSAAEIRCVQDWAGSVFAGLAPKAGDSRINIEVRRQDYNTLHFGQSCMTTPIKLGQIGISVNEMRPLGECDFGDQRLEAVSELGIIAPGSKVRVVAIDNGRPTVRAVDA